RHLRLTRRRGGPRSRRRDASPTGDSTCAPHVKGKAMAVGTGDLGRLTDGFAGEVVRPDDPGYHAARVVWNSMIDRRPALIVRPTGTDDIVTALRFAREQELVIAVR